MKLGSNLGCLEERISWEINQWRAADFVRSYMVGTQQTGKTAQVPNSGLPR